MDLHIHSEYSPDSHAKIDNIIKKSKQENLEIIAISDHNTIDGTEEIMKKTRNTDILAIPSIEISSASGHILGLGCEEIVPKGLEAEDTIDRIHDLDGLAIIPHPYCFYRHGLLCKKDYKKLKIDGIETKNARFIIGYCNNKYKKLYYRSLWGYSFKNFK